MIGKNAVDNGEQFRTVDSKGQTYTIKKWGQQSYKVIKEEVFYSYSEAIAEYDRVTALQGCPASHRVGDYQ